MHLKAVNVELYAAFSGCNLVALSKHAGVSPRAAYRVIQATEKERVALLNQVEEGASLSPEQLARLDRLQRGARP